MTPHPANSEYPDPELAVSCTDELIVVQSNGIPSFEFVPTTPNALQAQSYSWEIPRYPEVANAASDVPLGGPVAIAVNGLPLFGPTEAPFHGYRDPVLDQLLDYCAGHTAPGGVYHFHARPDCLFEDAEGNTSLVLGYAFDGYPILAPWMCEDSDCASIKPVESSWSQIEEVYGTTIDNAWDAHEYIAGSGDLDECNGRELAGGGYAYYMTDTFPYFMGCYRGVVHQQ